MANAWVEHIKRFARANGKSYGCALSDPQCRATYKNAKDERRDMGSNDAPAPAPATVVRFRPKPRRATVNVVETRTIRIKKKK
jgi:hypothetical protein